MKALVIGNGCRESALIKALSEGPKKAGRIFALPGRPGMAAAEPLPASFLRDRPAFAEWLGKERPDLCVIGPEQPLVEGLADFLRGRGVSVFGPGARAARLEGSKIFAKQFMKGQGIPTASYQTVSSVSEALSAAENFFPPFVLKADGLAGGKGVFICADRRELEEKSRLLFEKKALGKAGERALIEDFQRGREMSVFILTNGGGWRLLPLARDYKRLREGQKGPNTGGMGALAPVTAPPELMEAVQRGIIQPTVEGLQKRGMTYRGVLYIGLMARKNIPKVLEYNVRFGDPEAQALLPLLDDSGSNVSWTEAFAETAAGRLPELKWKPLHAACAVLAAAGYPERPVKGAVIEGPVLRGDSESYLLPGAMAFDEARKKWLTDGGRVLDAVGIGKTRKEALDKAYKLAEKITWPGRQLRRDIGADADDFS